MLNVIESVHSETPLTGPWLFDHAETFSPQTLDRIKALGGAVAIQNRMLFQGEYFVQRYGKKTAAQAPPVRAMLDREIPVALGTDGTRVSSYNPWLALYWLTTGKTWGGLKHLADENILSRREALKTMTHASARFTGEENQKGTIDPGKFADFAILAEDYFTVEAEALKDMEAVLTVVDGRIAYGSGEYQELDPELPPLRPDWSPVHYYGGYAGRR